MIESNAMIANKCMDILSAQVGVVDAEKFLFYVRYNDFDYTKWQREHYDSIAPDELKKAVEEHSKTKPFEGQKAVVI